MSVCCDGLRWHILCLRHGILVWQHIGQSNTATSRHRREMTSNIIVMLNPNKLSNHIICFHSNVTPCNASFSYILPASKAGNMATGNCWKIGWYFIENTWFTFDLWPVSAWHALHRWFRAEHDIAKFSFPRRIWLPALWLWLWLLQCQGQLNKSTHTRTHIYYIRVLIRPYLYVGPISSCGLPIRSESQYLCIQWNTFWEVILTRGQPLLKGHLTL